MFRYTVRYIHKCKYYNHATCLQLHSSGISSLSLSLSVSGRRLASVILPWNFKGWSWVPRKRKYPRYQRTLATWAQHPTTRAPTLHVQYQPLISPSKVKWMNAVWRTLLECLDLSFTLSRFSTELHTNTSNWSSVKLSKT